jgi:hypothetical protein
MTIAGEEKVNLLLEKGSGTESKLSVPDPFSKPRGRCRCPAHRPGGQSTNERPTLHKGGGDQNLTCRGLSLSGETEDMSPGSALIHFQTHVCISPPSVSLKPLNDGYRIY